ncbi:MAG: hypothetical protein SFV81_20185, partial [Pirellulaceae bacterium]|nr:hypothetical protein [Pirellulaceae bacterium]
MSKYQSSLALIACIFLFDGYMAGAQTAATYAPEELRRHFQNEATGHRWMLICCGLPGDDMHRERLTTAVARIVGATEPVFEVPSNRLRVLVGDETMADALKDLSVRPDVCTAEETAASLQALAKQIQPNDSLWIICLGHAQLYAGRSTFNVKGKDFDASELSKWLAPVQCRERIVMLTMPVSGFWIKPLRGPN